MPGLVSQIKVKIKNKQMTKKLFYIFLGALAVSALSGNAVVLASGDSGGGGSSGRTASGGVDDNPSASDLSEASAKAAGVDDNPSASDLLEGRNSGLDSARDILEAQGFDFSQNLSRGMRGDDVISLQRILDDDGFFHAEHTGFFGEITEEAVREFQTAHGLPTTGFVGPLTRAELSRRTRTQTRTQSGISEAEVRGKIAELQVKLAELQKKINDIQLHQ